MLVYDDPPASGRPGPVEPVRDGYRLSVGGVFSALRRRIVWIFACALVLAGIGLVGGKLLSPRYTAEAQIYIDPRDLNLVSRELTTGGQDSNAYQSVVERPDPSHHLEQRAAPGRRCHRPHQGRRIHGRVGRDGLEGRRCPGVRKSGCAFG